MCALEESNEPFTGNCCSVARISNSDEGMGEFESSSDGGVGLSGTSGTVRKSRHNSVRRTLQQVCGWLTHTLHQAILQHDPAQHSTIAGYCSSSVG
jgi:hypothetical protein